ncbi:carboxymuconolactone decarboxylase family protein [Plantactinospora sp. ZYX-F-223]|uniref:carboxymuconolactone decarboxylase family protein n=1 Tax=Plantactinospora sp. ZYX-F-223 TaxID=3144103 RepID=UPI0031FE15FF
MSPYVRHITPIPPERADGIVAEVYAQVNAEFSSIGPAVRMASPAPEIMAAGWALMRESQLTGVAPLVDKALVALGVAQVNGCGYDEVAHLGILRALGRPDLADSAERGEPVGDPAAAALLDWSRSTGTAGSLLPPPAGPVAEYVGTALFNHFIQRMALALLPPDLRPGTLDPADEPPFEDAPVLRELRPDAATGTSLALLAGLPTATPPAWAAGAPVGQAYAALAATCEQGGGLLAPAARAVVTGAIDRHHGRRPAGTDWLAEALSTLDSAERAGARVAILAGLAPGALTDEHVAQWRATDPRLSDHCTVYLLGYGAMRAVGQIEAGLAAALRASRATA